jgi:hypothetical protein
MLVSNKTVNRAHHTNLFLCHPKLAETCPGYYHNAIKVQRITLFDYHFFFFFFFAFTFSRQSIPLIGCTPLSPAYLLYLRTVGPVGWHHLARCPSWGLHAVGSLGVHGSLSSVLCCKSIGHVGRCHLFSTCGIGGATSCCARFRSESEDALPLSVDDSQW